jgi:hypothetical protein
MADTFAQRGTDWCWVDQQWSQWKAYFGYQPRRDCEHQFAMKFAD